MDASDRTMVHHDGAGLKTLFSHGIRRFASGSLNKDPSFTCCGRGVLVDIDTVVKIIAKGPRAG